MAFSPTKIIERLFDYLHWLLLATALGAAGKELHQPWFHYGAMILATAIPLHVGSEISDATIVPLGRRGFGLTWLDAVALGVFVVLLGFAQFLLSQLTIAAMDVLSTVSCKG